MPGDVHSSLLDQAERSWKAEEVNAARVAARANLVLSAILALVAALLLIVRHEALLIDTLWQRVTFAGLLLSAMIFAVLALADVLHVRLKASGEAPGSPSSNELRIDHRLAARPWVMKQSEATAYAFRLTYNAAAGLYHRNQARQRAVDRAQRRLMAAVLLVFLSQVMYIGVIWFGDDDERQENPVALEAANLH
jgi:uncharacterized membrane protein YbhN (UPF0104 family)